MRIVIDTNVLISSFIGRGTSHKVLEHCIRHHDVVTSHFILDELQEKLTDKFKYTTQIAEEAISLLKSRMEVVIPSPLPTPLCRDSDDDNVLATALAGQCKLIITGDKDLLVLGQMNDIKIVNPATFAQSEAIE
jgi:putative PIN family toxin of toxin-antitoxin system